MDTHQPHIELTPVDSKQLHAIGYSPAQKVLAIQFKNWKGEVGATYHYTGVDQAMFDEFDKAESKGAFFGARIKPNADKYPFTRLPPEEKAA